MVDTLRTRAAIQALFANNSTRNISEQDLRDFVQSILLRENNVDPLTLTEQRREYTLPSAFGYSTSLGSGYGPGPTAWVANRIGLVPYRIQIPFSSLSVLFTINSAAAAGKKVKAAIWDLDELGRATTKLAESADIAADSTGDKTAILTYNGRAGWYWFGLVSNGTPSLYNLYAYLCSLGSAFIIDAIASYLTCYKDATYASLPSPLGTPSLSNLFYMTPQLLITPTAA